MHKPSQHSGILDFALTLIAWGVCVLAAASVFAQPATVPVVDASVFAPIFVASLQSHSWLMAGAAAVMLAVWALGKFGLLSALNPKYVPWVGVVLGAVTAVAAALVSHSPIAQALMAGLNAGLAGVGAWEAAGQHFLSGPAPK